jgi:hypothetical protein
MEFAGTLQPSFERCPSPGRFTGLLHNVDDSFRFAGG